MKNSENSPTFMQTVDDFAVACLLNTSFCVADLTLTLALENSDVIENPRNIAGSERNDN